jgi:hypothetical protein
MTCGRFAREPALDFSTHLKNNLGELRSKKRFSKVKSIQADPCGFRKPFPYMMWLM